MRIERIAKEKVFIAQKRKTRKGKGKKRERKDVLVTIPNDFPTLGFNRDMR